MTHIPVYLRKQDIYKAPSVRRYENIDRRISEKYFCTVIIYMLLIGKFI